MTYNRLYTHFLPHFEVDHTHFRILGLASLTSGYDDALFVWYPGCAFEETASNINVNLAGAVDPISASEVTKTQLADISGEHGVAAVNADIKPECKRDIQSPPKGR